ncbi:hypothetical protein BO71DRAFT_410583 [Aspergillus ellipticus CBS 707.79]|uniref:Uncharacterized protein n=1 Tax=Aspergillus ellipticus CBS 707.79 TaxID=1448320 RepID=A0A319D6Q3_9EURO|nr:hypothetical protein BO71DRAFT_410583 [Aspergillus ellipticus CBS 707.79]
MPSQIESDYLSKSKSNKQYYVLPKGGNQLKLVTNPEFRERELGYCSNRPTDDPPKGGPYTTVQAPRNLPSMADERPNSWLNERSQNRSPEDTSPGADPGNGNEKPDVSPRADPGNGNERPDASPGADPGNGNERPDISPRADPGNGNERPDASPGVDPGNRIERPDELYRVDPGKEYKKQTDS